jgi:hypothetical protein
MKNFLLIKLSPPHFFQNHSYSCFSLPSKHSSGCQQPDELPADLLHAPLIWERFACPYDGPYIILHPGPALSPSGSGPGTRSSTSAVSSSHAWTRTPNLAVRDTMGLPPGTGVVAKLATTRHGSQTRWFLHLSSNLCSCRALGNHFFLTLREGFCTPQDGLSFEVSTAVVPTATAGTASNVGPLTSPPPRPELVGTPVETAIFTLAAGELVTAGGRTQHHAVYSIQQTVLPVCIALCIQ